VAGANFTINQAGITSCAITLDPPAVTSPAAGETNRNVTVTVTPSSCAWVVAKSVDWITLGATQSGTGNGSFTFSVATNPGTVQRISAITVGSKTLAVTQLGGGAPGAAQLVSPSGSIATATPTYTWNAVTGATQYYLWVNNPGASPKIQQWYTADQAGCASGGSTCSVTPSTVLAAGAAQWYIQTWNANGYGPWSNALSFTVPGGSTPGKAILISPSGATSTANPTYAWNAVSGSAWYYLWVSDSGASAKIQRWYTAAQAGCASGTGTCSVSSPAVLAQGAAVWWIQTWNDTGYGPWSDGMAFTVSAGVAGTATLLSPTGTISTRNPTYSWNAVANATYYYLWVNDSSGNKIATWYTASQAGCGSGTGVCSVTPATGLSSGAATWWIQTWNPSGFGLWSAGMGFIVP
jgi:hypothetical protein